MILSLKRTYSQYSKEFNEKVVVLVREKDYSVPDTMKFLGIGPKTLYKWKEEFDYELDGKVLVSNE